MVTLSIVGSDQALHHPHDDQEEASVQHQGEPPAHRGPGAEGEEHPQHERDG